MVDIHAENARQLASAYLLAQFELVECSVRPDGTRTARDSEYQFFLVRDAGPATRLGGEKYLAVHLASGTVTAHVAGD